MLKDLILSEVMSLFTAEPRTKAGQRIPQTCGTAGII